MYIMPVVHQLLYYMQPLLYALFIATVVRFVQYIRVCESACVCVCIIGGSIQTKQPPPNRFF